MRLPVSLGAVEIFIHGIGLGIGIGIGIRIAKIKRNASIFLKLIAFCVRLLEVLGKFSRLSWTCRHTKDCN